MGFLQANHGVRTELLDKMMKATQELFKMPIEEKKKKFMQEEGDLEGYGQSFVASEDQKLEWADIFYVCTLPLRYRKAHLFNKLPIDYRPALEAYSAEVKGIAKKLINTIKPYPYAFVVNIGDILEIITNGTYRSIEHRAICNLVKERISIASFHSPLMEMEFGPAPSLIANGARPQFLRTTTANYYKGVYARELGGKSYLDTVRLS